MVLIRPSQLWHLGCSTAPAHSWMGFVAEGARVAAGSNAALTLCNHAPAGTAGTRDTRGASAGLQESACPGHGCGGTKSNYTY